jgi:LacI family transcriptional regulator
VSGQVPLALSRFLKEIQSIALRGKLTGAFPASLHPYLLFPLIKVLRRRSWWDTLTMPIRMKDIAEDLGVSLMTVSKGLRNELDIGEATRKRIQKRAREMNYVPNINARSLATGKSNLIGLIVPDLLHPFFADVAHGLAMTLRKKDYFLIMTSSEEDPQLEKKEIEQLLTRRLDALVIAPVRSNAKAYQNITAQRIPYILIDRKVSGNSGHFVGCDDTKIGFLATEHLIKIGCKRIAHIRGPKTSTGNGRFTGYKRALSHYGMAIRDEYIVNGKLADTNGRQSGAWATRSLLHLRQRPDGIFCFNDPLAVGASRELQERDIQVPEEVALIGCGNVHYDDALRIPLSSIDQQSHKIGERAAHLALDLIKSGMPGENCRILLEPRLTVRASSQRQK